MIKEEILNILKQNLKPEFIEVIDESEKHASHEGARQSGGGHYILTIASESFNQKNLMDRHKMVYQVLKGFMKEKIHALSIKAYTPSEYENKN